MAQNDTAAPAEAPVPAATPKVGWKLPPGWQETGSDGISLENFTAPGPGTNVAVVSLTRLDDLSGKDGLLVNMWRDQVKLPPLPDDEAVRTIQPVPFSSGVGNYFEVLGTNDGTAWKIITGFMHTPQGSWFCKMVGDSALVTAQKPVFLEFLKSIVIQYPATPTTPATTQVAATEANGAAPNWTVPSAWQSLPPGQMQVALFHVPEQNGAKAEVSVSVFPTEAGGTLTNINRWRTKYVGLPEIQAKDLPQVASSLDATHPGAVLVDMQNDKKRLIGAIVPRDGSYWFYRLNGDNAAVAPQKDSFIAFAKSNP